METFKRDRREFGGQQFVFMSPEEIASRMCCAKGCGEPGYVQTMVSVPDDPPEIYAALGLRIMCKWHLVRVALAIATVLGDPSPSGEAMDVARRVGVDWSVFLRDKPIAEPIQPEEFRCLTCGGQLAAETVGMFSGRRWVHTCGVSQRDVDVYNVKKEAQ